MNAWALLFVTALQADPAEVLREAGVETGLAVHLGATDGRLEIGLTHGGRVLVHGLALEDRALAEARRNIQARGLYGLASIERARTLDPLPYADNLVTLLVADADAPEREILRVLAPKGVALIRRGGETRKLVKPRPKEMDDWTHFDYGPEGNGVSNDLLVKPATLVQWILGLREMKLGGNPAGYRVMSGMRIADGRVFFEWARSDDKKSREAFYSGRDAWNGLPIWTSPHGSTGSWKEHHLVASKESVFTFLEKNGPMVALDAATGKVARTYDHGGRAPETNAHAAIRHAGGILVQTAGDTLYVIDAATGALRWKHAEPDSRILFPSASARDDRVFVAVVTEQGKGHYSRWPYDKLSAILCFELSTGKLLWRNVEVAGGEIGQLVYADGLLAIFGSGAIGGGNSPYIGAISVADGKLLWNATFKKEYNRFGYNLLVRDGTLYYADAWRIYAHDPKTGAETRPFDDGGYNMRCNRFAATPDYFIYGYVAYVDKNWGGTYQSICRGGCSQGSVPANGMMYFTPNTCRCFVMLRGHMALSSEPLREPVPDDRRLEKGDGVKAPVPEARATALPEGPVAADWTRQDRAPTLETAPVTAEGRSYVAVVHEHRLEARGTDGKPLWSFTAGGRISAPPALHDGLCLFGSHDGWVYALRADDGALAWRFLAAPYERKLAAYNQLESSWPVYGVTLHEGLACFSAGLHPEVGGGIHVYGVEPATGVVKWKKLLRKPAVALAAKKKQVVVPNRILNDALRSEGGALHLPGISFTPADSEDDLKAKIEDPLPRKK